MSVLPFGSGLIPDDELAAMIAAEFLRVGASAESFEQNFGITPMYQPSINYDPENGAPARRIDVPSTTELFIQAGIIPTDYSGRNWVLELPESQLPAVPVMPVAPVVSQPLPQTPLAPRAGGGRPPTLAIAFPPGGGIPYASVRTQGRWSGIVLSRLPWAGPK